MIKAQLRRFDFPVAFAILILIIGGHIISASRASALPVILLQTGDASAGYSNGDEPRSVRQCRGTLRSIGSAQIAYASFYGAGKFGTLTDLQLSGFIAYSFTPDTIAPGYSIGWFLNRNESDFAIIAMPSETPELQAFMIDSRQELLKIDPVEDVPQPVGWEHIMQIQGEGYADIGKYVWPEVLESNDPPREFNVFQNGDRQVYLIAYIAPFIDYNELTFKPEPEYIYLSDIRFYYMALPDEELDMIPPE